MVSELTIEGNVADKCFDFSLRQGDHVIPATFWKAKVSSNQAPPLVLLQHGGPMHKRHEFVDTLANTIVDRTGAAVLLIDGPIHGKRRVDEPEIMEMLALFKQYWRDEAGIEGYVADWRAALNAVLDKGWADPARIAWFGLSMGTAYGVPLCAVEGRIKAAALGMWGTDWGQESRLLADARLVKIPVLFQIKTEDEFFSTEGQRKLFEALGSSDKFLSIYEGSHSMSAPGQLDQLLNFVARAVSNEQSRASSTDTDSEVTA